MYSDRISLYQKIEQERGTKVIAYVTGDQRGLIESVAGGSHVLISEGTLTRATIQIQPGVPGIQISDQRLFEGWRHNPDE